MIEVTEEELAGNKVSISGSYYGIEVNGILFKNGEETDCLVIYSQGHGGDPFRFQYHNILRLKTRKKM